MRIRRTLAFVVLALLAGGVVSQLPSAMGDDSESPFSALWDAIFDLQSRDNDLQVQINELRAERDALLVQTGSEPVFVSDSYAGIEVEATEDGRTLVHITAGNSGPDRAAGVKLTAFYLMPLFEINFIDNGQCEDKSRGIIECTLGTLEEGQESVITVDATARESGKANTWTVDISTTTNDADYTNNHATYDFETGSGERIEIPQVEQPVQEEPEEEVQEPEAAEPEQNSGSSSAETEEPQEISGNQTSMENGSEETSGNQTSSETDSETVDDSGSNSTGTEDVSSEQPEESSSEEETSDGSTQEEQPSESPSETEEPVEDTSGEGGADESSEGSGSESSGSEESGSEESGDESSGEQESSESEESSEGSESSEESPQ